MVGLCELRRRAEENLLTLKSGHAFRYYGNPTRSSGGTGFLVNKKLEGKIVNIRTISDDVRNILYKRPLQHGDNTAYVSATEHDDQEMEDLYGHIDIARRENKYLMGDFNAKIGKQKQRSENPAWMAATREREITDKLKMHLSPGGRTKDEIDSFITARETSQTLLDKLSL